MSRRRSNGGLYFLLILLIAAMYASTFFCKVSITCVPEPFFIGRLFDTSLIFNTSALSVILGTVTMALTAASLLVLQNRFTSGFNFSLPLIYLTLCLTNPANIYLTPAHFASLLTLWSLYYLALFRIERPDLSRIFTSTMLLLCAALFFPPLLWLAPVMFVYGLGVTCNKAKYLICFALGIILPLSALFCIDFIINTTEELKILHKEFRSALIPAGDRNLVFTAPELCRTAIILLTIIIAFLHVMKNLSLYKIAKSRLYSLMMLLLPSITLIIILFMKSNHDTVVMPIYIPASILVFEYFTESSTKNIRTIIALMFASLVAVERAMSIF